MPHRVLQLTVLVLLAFLASCASTRFESQLAADFSGTVDRLFVIADVAGTWERDDIQALADQLEGALGACAEVAVHVLDPLTLDREAADRHLEEFAPSYVLLLEQTMEKVQSQGLLGDSPRGFVFQAALVDAAARKPVWRATLDSGGNSSFRLSYIESLVGELVSGMQEDGLIVCAESALVREREQVRERDDREF